MQIQLTVLLDDDLKLILDNIKLQEGIPIAAQIRFALLTWLEQRGSLPTKKIARK